ncbi:hypothetical protein MRB53_037373 [Persea americana]|nr:hypothetical protein MRB53_037373 [Persea americana]
MFRLTEAVLLIVLTIVTHPLVGSLARLAKSGWWPDDLVIPASMYIVPAVANSPIGRDAARPAVARQALTSGRPRCECGKATVQQLQRFVR